MKSLYIKNYMNLRELSIDSLARVNLIVGCNNVGKSTLLEAVSIYFIPIFLNILIDIISIH